MEITIIQPVLVEECSCCSQHHSSQKAKPLPVSLNLRQHSRSVATKSESDEGVGWFERGLLPFTKSPSEYFRLLRITLPHPLQVFNRRRFESQDPTVLVNGSLRSNFSGQP